MQVFPVVASSLSINQVGRNEKLLTLNHYASIDPQDSLISYTSCNLSITYLLPKGIKIKNGMQSSVDCCNLHHCLLHHPKEGQIKCILLLFSKINLIRQQRKEDSKSV